ncbi:DUF11 domain-containing protein [Leptolyngbya sp. 'hensonii']|uniref:beta strand repeat-containing protein n=1 Tax=Leptolyngbya sp. 'hensonii' TaxID=1922337 RepID=UPI0015C573EC|nr:DUF11 domain-containing protein [Leptolyngbya sp. 'hensonii']
MMHPIFSKFSRSCRYALLAIVALLGTLLFHLGTTPPAIAQVASLNKSFSPLQINPGQSSTLTVTLFNSATTALTNAAVTDNLPAGMGIANPPAITNTCGGTVTAIAGSTAFSLAGGNVPAKVGTVDGQCSFSVNVTTTVQGNSVNTIPVNAFTNDQGQTNATPASATLQVRTMANPGLSKNFTPSNTIFAGQTTNLLIRVTNNDANVVLTAVSLTDNLPTNVTVAGAATTNCTGGTAATTATSVTLTGGSINPGANCTVTVPVTSTVTGSYTNTLPIGSLTNTQGVTNASVATANLTVQNLSVTKAFSPSTNIPGSPSTLTITLFNPSGAAYTGVGVTDNLPSGLLVASPPNTSTTCGAGTVNAAAGASSFNLTGGTIPAAVGATPGSCTVTVSVVASSTGNRTNTIPAGGVTTAQGATNVAPGSATLSVVAGLNPVTLAKTFLTNPIPVGAPSVLRIRLTNPNGSPNVLTSLGITDTLPTNVVIANPPNASTTCSGGTVTATAGGNSVTLSGGTLNINSNCDVLVSVTGTAPGAYLNSIPANSITNAQGRTNTSAANATLNVTSGVEISKAFFPNTIAPGGRSTLIVTLTNYLTTAVTGVQLTDNLPQGARPIRVANSPNNAATTCGTGTVTAVANATSFTLSNGTIPAAQGAVPGICTFQVEVTSTASSSNNTNTIPSGALTSTQGVTNLLQAQATLNFTPLPVNVIKSFNPLTVSGGSTSTMTVTLTNPSTTQTYLQTTFTDTMPAGMQVASVPNATTNCTNGIVTAVPGANTFTFSNGQIAPNTSCNVSLQVTSTVTGNRTNTIPIGGVTTFQGATNTSAASATLTNLPGLGVGKAFSPSLVQPGDTALLTITIINANPIDLTSLSLTDTLPSGVTIAPIPNGTTTCTSGTVTTTADSVTITGGSMVASTSCTVSVNVTVAAIGTYNNVIPANAITTAEGVTNPLATSGSISAVNFPTLSKTFNPTTISQNGLSTLTLQLGNPNAAAITLTAVLTDTLPAGVSVANPPNIGGTCTSANVTAVGGGNTIAYASGATIPVGGCTISVQVTSAISGSFTNTIPAGGLQTTSGNNPNPASASLTVGSAPNLLLVKRITAVVSGGVTTPFNTVFNAATTIISDPNNDDGNANWPAGYLQGGGVPDAGVSPADPVDAVAIKPGDQVEYTIYFLNAGGRDARKVRLCDRLEPNQTFVPTAYNGSSPGDGGSATNQGLALAIGSTAPTAYLTNVADAPDRGEFVASPTVPAKCNTVDNPNGTIVVDVTRDAPLSPQSIPYATAPGTPTGSYGFIRFRTQVN